MAEPNLRPVEHVDLPRYMGRWYVISHTPNILEKGKVGTADHYRLRPDGRIEDTYTFHQGSLDAPEKEWHAIGSVAETGSNAIWDVTLTWPIQAGYRVLELDPEYRWVAISTDSAKRLWIMAREPHLDDTTYGMITAKLAARHLDTTRLERVPQKAP